MANRFPADFPVNLLHETSHPGQLSHPQIASSVGFKVCPGIAQVEALE